MLSDGDTLSSYVSPSGASSCLCGRRSQLACVCGFGDVEKRGCGGEGAVTEQMAAGYICGSSESAQKSALLEWHCVEEKGEAYPLHLKSSIHKRLAARSSNTQWGYLPLFLP